MDIDALVVGAGPVGLVAALELARHGLTSTIIDRAAAPSTFSKALVIFARTLETFRLMGVAEDFVATGRQLEKIAFYRQQVLLAKLSFATLPSPYPFALGLPQSETERLLGRRLSEQGVHVKWSTELVGLQQHDDSVEARVRTPSGEEQVIRASWLLGCDGAHSTVRHLLGLTFKGAAYDESFLLADVRLSGELPEGDVILIFADQGVLGIFRFSEERARIIAQFAEESPEQSAEPSLETLQSYLRERCPGTITASDPTWISRFRIARRKVRRFRVERVFLAGDAAHVHSPAGGQGMNTGIQDAFNLVWKMKLVTRKNAPESLLDSYTAEREPVARSVLALTDYLTRMATSRNPLVQSARTMLVPLFSEVEQVGERIIEAMSGIRVNYRRSPIIIPDHGGALRAGDRAPDAEIQDPAAGKPLRLFDLFGSGKHVLLVFAGTGSRPALSPMPALLSLRQRFASLVDGIEIVCCAANPRPDFLVVGDTGMAHAVYGVEVPTIFVIRPDGYIALRTSSEDLYSLEKYFQLIFGKEGQV